MARYGICYDGAAIVYSSGSAWIVRTTLAFFGTVPPAGLVMFWLVTFREIDWAAAPTWWEFTLLTLLFLVGPLAIGGLFVGLALFGRSDRLRLDPSAGTAALTASTLFRRWQVVVPLAALELTLVELLRDHPGREDPELTLAFPDGTEIKMGCFANDADALEWRDRIAGLIG